jgi:hypothetical protein
LSEGCYAPLDMLSAGQPENAPGQKFACGPSRYSGNSAWGRLPEVFFRGDKQLMQANAKSSSSDILNNRRIAHIHRHRPIRREFSL